MVDPIQGLLVVAAALAFFGWVGFRARRRGDDLEDYLVARNSQTSGVLGMSFLASGMGAWILFAPPQVGATVGLAAVLGYAAGAGAPIAAFGLLGPRLRRIVPVGHSLTEFVRLRFGRTFHAYVVGISVLYMLVFVTAELTAVGAVTAILTGGGGRLAVVGVAAVTAAYTAYGGLRASLRTDRWQGWFIVALLGIAAAAILVALPSPGGAWRGSGLLAPNRVGVEAGITLFVAVLVANLFHQGYWQRVWSARDHRSLARGAGLGVALSVPVVALVGAVGILAAGSGTDLGSPPVPFFALLGGLGALVALVVLALAVALVASSVDTLTNGLASLVTAERPTIGMAGARVVTVGLLVPVAALAMQGHDVLRIFLIADLLAATAAAPAMLGLWSRATPRAALYGAIAGVIGAVTPGWVSTGSIAGAWEVATFADAIPTLPPFAAAVLASSAVTVAVSLLSGRTTDLESLGESVPSMSGR